jgi:precorrin-3B C17-methyltransferase
MSILFVVGIGPGGADYLTNQAKDALRQSQAVCGYKTYIEQIGELLNGKTIYSNSMGGEVERVKKAVNFAKNGITTSLISGGDASLYGMTSLAYEIGLGLVEIVVVAGVTAALACASRLGAPISDDLAIISMSDVLTPWDIIKKRIDAVNLGDFVCAIYNPKSKNRTMQIEYALDKFFSQRGNLFCGSVKRCFRADEQIKISNLLDFDYDFVDMSTTVIVGSSKTYLKNGKLITPRGYKL